MFCKHCGKKIPDYARFCIYCGGAVTPLSETPVAGATPVAEAPKVPDTPVIPDIPEAPDTSAIPDDPGFFHKPASLLDAEAAAPEIPSASFPEIPDLTPPGLQTLDASYVSEDEAAARGAVGSYQEIMAEFSGSAPEPPAEPHQPPQAEPTKEKKLPDILGSKKRIILASGLILAVCLVGAVILVLLRLSPSEVQAPAEISVMTPAPEPPAEAPETLEASETSEIQALPQIAPPAAETPVPPPASREEEIILYIDGSSHSADFRSAPNQDEDNILASLLAGTAVTFLDRAENDFSKVLVEGVTGYVASDALSETLPELEAAATGYITGVDYCACFRSSPEKNEDNILDMLYLDQPLDFIEETDTGYGRVRVGDAYGYVYMDYISFTPPNTTPAEILYISGINNGAYLLAYPRQGTDVLSTLRPGTTVGYIEDSANGYCRVVYEDTIGYVLGSYLSEANPASEENKLAREALLRYAEGENLTYVCLLDVNGDGIEELLASEAVLPQDSFSVSTCARLLIYQDGSVQECALLGDTEGTDPILYLKQEDGSLTLVAEASDTGLYVCTFYRLARDGALTREAWSIEREDGEKKYYVNKDGTREETTEDAYKEAVEAPSYFYAIFEEATP